MELAHPGMTLLHRVGLAGLSMTLEYLERSGTRIPGSWELGPRSVTLYWPDTGPEPFLRALIEATFRVDRHGLIWFTPLGEAEQHPASATLLHEALLGTFLQHPKSRGAESSTHRSGIIAMHLDEESTVRVDYPFQKVSWYKHQQAVNILFDKAGRLVERVPVTGWLFPGGVVRHNAFPERSALDEPLETWLPLLFAPVGAVYFHVRAATSSNSPRFAVALPEISDLRAYSLVRRHLLTDALVQLTVGGAAEAAWRLLAEMDSADLLDVIGTDSCDVVAFGTVSWSLQQKTRIDVFSVRHVPRDAVQKYRIAREAVGPRIVHRKDGPPFIAPSPVLDVVSRNLAAGRPWYAGFTRLMADPQSRQALTFDRRRLKTMVVSMSTDDGGAASVFVEACHEAWRRRMGQLKERASNEQAAFDRLVEAERERLRSSLTRCKNVDTFRSVITDFWARAGGSLRSLRAGWRDVLPFLSEGRWQEGRDLALLALASYAREESSEERTGKHEGAD